MDLNPHAAQVAKKIEDAAPHIQLVSDTIQALRKLFFLCTRRTPLRPPSSRYRQVIATLAARAYGLLEAIYHLCSRGYSSEAQLLLRSLLELTLSALYMAQGDRRALADRYVEYEVVINSKLLEGLIQTGVVTDPAEQAQLRAKQEEIACVRQAYERKYGPGSTRSWHGMNWRDLSMKLGMKWFKHYVGVYRSASDYSHGTVVSLLEYVKWPSRLAIDPRPAILFGPTAEGLQDLLLFSVEFTLELARDWTTEMELHSQAEVLLGRLATQHNRLAANYTTP